MDILLVSDVKNLGKRGKIVTVKDGFARNFLLPQKLGIIATAEAKVHLEQQKEKAHEQSKTDEARSREYARELDGKAITIQKPKTDKGTLYAALTERDIKEALATQLSFHPRGISVSSTHHLKHIGEYTVSIDCGHNQHATVIVIIK